MSEFSPPISTHYPPLHSEELLDTLEISRWNGQPYFVSTQLFFAFLCIYLRPSDGCLHSPVRSDFASAVLFVFTYILQHSI
mgnify:CR=1 FL=1